ncbi:MAG: universal stress protein [Deinococcales bacterium]|jgi:nucleotide-binding universal stress UspA family protein
MEFARILIPVDGSPCSDRAVQEAIALGRIFGSALTFLSVVDNPLRGVYGYSEGIGYYSDVIEALERTANAALEQAAAAARAAGLDVDIRLVTGEVPVDAILKAEEDHDLTVLGTHGRHGVDRVFLGSVTEGVLRHSRLPHLVVRCGSEVDESAA